MVHATFTCTAPRRFTCRETGDRYAVIPFEGRFLCYINECRQVSRPTMAEALTWVEQEARLGIASEISNNA